jgi:hypothetical protein
MSPGKSYSVINFGIWIHKKTGYAYLRLWLITTKLSVTVCKTLETNWELDVAAAHNILNLEFRKLGVEAKLLDNARIPTFGLYSALRACSAILWDPNGSRGRRLQQCSEE